MKPSVPIYYADIVIGLFRKNKHATTELKTKLYKGQIVKGFTPGQIAVTNNDKIANDARKAFGLPKETDFEFFWKIKSVNLLWQSGWGVAD